MQKILVTGGMGFIGSHLTDKLVECGFDVTIYDIQKTRYNIPQGVRWIRGDIGDFEQLRKAAIGKDGIVHLAAVSRVSAGNKNPLECMKTNVIGATNVLESVRVTGNQAWVILGSTREVFGISDKLPTTESTPQNTSNIYAVSKLAAELCCERYAKDYGLRVMILRFSDVYGSDRDNLDKVLPKLILRALKDLDLYVSGEQQFDFTHWKDIINGILLGIQYLGATENGYYGEFTLCTGKQTSLNELADIILRESASKSTIISSGDRLCDVNRLFADPTKAMTALNYEAKIDIHQGIKETVEILKKVEATISP